MQQHQIAPQQAAQELKALVLSNATQGFVFRSNANRSKRPFACEDGQDLDGSPEKALEERHYANWLDACLNGIRQGWATIERGKSGLIFRFTGTGDRYPSAGVRFEITGSIPQDLMRQVAQLK